MSGNPVANAQGDNLLYGGPVDPRVTALDIPINAIYIYAPESGTGAILQKLDNGVTTNYAVVPTSAIFMALDFSNSIASSVDIDLGANKIVDLADPTDPQDAATKNYVDSLPSDMATNFSNSVASTVDIDLGANKIVDLADPTDPQDAATKNYVDTLGGDFLEKAPNTIFVIDNGDFATLQEAVDVAPNGSLLIVGPKTGGWGDIVLPQNIGLTFAGLGNGDVLSPLIGEVTIAPSVGNTINASFVNMSFAQESGNITFNISGAGTYNITMDNVNILRETGATDSILVDSNTSASSAMLIKASTFRTFANELGGTIFNISSVGFFRMDSSQIIGGNICLVNSGANTLVTPLSSFQTNFTGPAVDLQAGTLFTGGNTAYINTGANASGINVAAGATANLSQVTFTVVPGTGFAVSGAGTITTYSVNFSNLNNSIEGTITQSVDFSSDINISEANLSSITSPGSLSVNAPSGQIIVQSSGSLSLTGQGLSVISNAATTMTLNGTTNINATSGPFSINNTDSGINLNAVEQIQLSSSANDVRLLTNGGNIRFLNSSQPAPSIGDVWTATSVNGDGYWAPAAGGGDLWSDPVDANIVPNSNDILEVGSSVNNFAQVHTRIVQSNNTLTLEASSNISFFGANLDVTGMASADFTGVTVTGLPSGGDLWSDPVDSNLVPDAPGTRNIGNSVNNAFSSGFFADIVQVGSSSTSILMQRFPNLSNFAANIPINAGLTAIYSAGSSTNSINLFTTNQSGSTSPIYAYTGDSSSNGNTGDIGLVTGNKTAGNGSSGPIILTTGNGNQSSGDIRFTTGSASGTRGKIKLDALMATLPVGTADPTGVDNGDSYYNTSTNQLRVFNGGTWRGITLV